MVARTRKQLRRHNIRAKKRLGQNVLLDKGILAQLAAAAELSLTDTVLEIGPGSGNLTVELARRAGAVIAVETDRDLEPVLAANLSKFDNIQVIWGDFLEQSLESLWQLAPTSLDGERKVVANLPYYITSPVLIKLLTAASHRPRLAVILVQLEVAERLVAEPGTKAYGSLSVLTQYFTCPELVLKVPPTAFFPRPKVWSAAIRLRFRDQPAVKVQDEEFFFKVVRAAFGHRRKTLLNSLHYDLGERIAKEDMATALSRAGIDDRRRGETLNIEEFALLTTALTELLR